MIEFRDQVEVEMAKGTRYSEQFKKDAVHQIVARGYPVAEVANRLGISEKTLYRWKKIHAGREKDPKARGKEDSAVEIARLKAELRRVTEERDILKKAAAYFAKESQ